MGCDVCTVADRVFAHKYGSSLVRIHPKSTEMFVLTDLLGRKLSNLATRHAILDNLPG